MRTFHFTRPRVDAAACEPGKTQTLFWDATEPGLGLRVTANGARSFIFEGRLGGDTVRLTIGPASMPIRSTGRGADRVPGADAQAAAWRLMLTQGRDPRIEIKAAADGVKAERAAERRRTVTARDAWDAYLIDRAPHWGARHLEDHKAKATPAGAIGKRGQPLRPGVLSSLLDRPLRELDAVTVETWAAREAKKHPTVARLAWRLLKAFLAWCSEQPEYAGALPADNPASTRRARESLGRPGVKRDALQREQLPAWFAAVRGIGNPTAAAYLQVLLLTGARPGEAIGIRWADMNMQWKSLAIRDKVEGERVIPLTPYVAHLLDALPRRGELVFAGPRAATIARPSDAHDAACKVAGIEGLTLHGLRRSFKSLSEWLDAPAGVVAQLQGHKPSATVERHYTVRPLDLLRVHAERIEAAILEWAGVEWTPAPRRLRVAS